MSFLSVDVGSSSCKAVAFAASGEELARYAHSYSPQFPRPSFAELDPERFWDALCSCCQSVSRNLKDPVRALALSSHGETFVPLDSFGRPLRNAILNQDNRAIDEAQWLENAIGRETLFKLTGHVAHAMYPIPKILWLRKHEPEVFRATACFATLIGYLLSKMGLREYVDYSLASRFLAFDVSIKGWCDTVLRAIELKEECLPVPVPTGTVVGELNADAAGELGLQRGTQVVLGGHDQTCGALGCGVIDSGRVANSMGTYECLLAVSNMPVLTDTALSACLNSYPHVIPDRFVTLAYFPAGIMMKWFHDLLFVDQDSKADGASSAGLNVESSRYAMLEAHCGNEPTGLCILPHLIGSCNPEFNPQARGLIAGISPGTRREDIYKGILEGIACELSLATDSLCKAAGSFHDVYATGGGTFSGLGLRLRAALSGRRLHVMRNQESVCLGTAILAGVAMKEYASYREAVSVVVKERDVVEPSHEIRANYQNQLMQYMALRSAVVSQA